MRTDLAFFTCFLFSCTKEAPPSATPEPSTSPVPVTTASAAAPAAASASASPSASTASSSAASPHSSADDPIALALPPTDAALRKNAKGPAHPGPFITAAEGRLSGDAKKGWTVNWSRHPPAGWEIEASTKVSPSKQVTVTKAEATFSPD